MLTDADFRRAAEKLGCTVAQIRAVDEVESGGGWFDDVRAEILDLDGPGGFLDGDRLPKLLFEAHYFSRHTGGRYDASHPHISSPTWNRSLYVGGQGEYERLHEAMVLDPADALKSASWGRYQIMGGNHKLAGFPDVFEFADAMKESEARHLEAFVAFVMASGLRDELRAIASDPASCRPFARGYNGSGYAANAYDVKIAKAHRKFAGGNLSGNLAGSRPTLRRGMEGPSVRTLQAALNLPAVMRERDFRLVADGHFGAQTEAAVKAWQRVAGLLPDGIAGPATWATLDSLPQPAVDVVPPPKPPPPVDAPDPVEPEPAPQGGFFRALSSLWKGLTR